LPIVVPSKVNKSKLPDRNACEAAAFVSDELTQKIFDRPLDQVLCSWVQFCKGGKCSPEQVEQVRHIIHDQKQLLLLRNKKHALNVSSMEAAIAILNSLDSKQRQFLLDNRDLAVAKVKNAPAWDLILDSLK